MRQLKFTHIPHLARVFNLGTKEVLWQAQQRGLEVWHSEIGPYIENDVAQRWLRSELQRKS